MLPEPHVPNSRSEAVAVHPLQRVIERAYDAAEVERAEGSEVALTRVLEVLAPHVECGEHQITHEMVERLARHICGIPGDVDLEPTDEARARARRHLEVAFGASSGDAEWRAPLPCDATCEGACFAWLPTRACRPATAAELAASSTTRDEERAG